MKELKPGDSHVGILPSEPAPKPEVKIGDQVIARGFFADVVEPFKAVTSDDYRMRILGIERWRGIETFLAEGVTSGIKYRICLENIVSVLPPEQPKEEPASKPGDMRGLPSQVFRSKEGWKTISRLNWDRRKPSTDPRYVALCALESLVNPYRNTQDAIGCLRCDLRKAPMGVPLGAGRNPHAAPRRKDDRRG